MNRRFLNSSGLNLVRIFAALAAASTQAAPSALAATAVAVLDASASASSLSEIRLVRNEGYADFSSELRIRSDSIEVIKHFDPMQRPGDTIGIFGCGGNPRLYSRLWEILDTASKAAGLRPDSRVLAVTGVRDGKTASFVIPLQPPAPSWAGEFRSLADSLEGQALGHPVHALTVTMKPLSAKRKQKAEVRLRNPGNAKAEIPASATLLIQGVRKPGAEGWPAGGPAWDSLAVIPIEKARILLPEKQVSLSRKIALGKKGVWYYRVCYRAEGPTTMDLVQVFGETYSRIDSVEIK